MLSVSVEDVARTGSVSRLGHRLRLAIQAFDVPHLLPNLTEALGSLSAITVYAGGLTPSVLTVPAVTP
jgi:uncharacterized protein